MIKKVLIFDDEKITYPSWEILIRTYLKTLKVNIYFVDNMPVFESEYPKCHFDLIIINLNMDCILELKLEGLKEFILKIQSTRKSSKIIAVTPKEEIRTLMGNLNVIAWFKTCSISLFTRSDKRKEGKITIECIDNLVSEQYKIQRGVIRTKTRKREITKPRQIVAYLSCMFTPLILKEIGWYLGYKDHSSVVSSRNTVNDLMDTDLDYKKEVEYFVDEINKLS